MLSSSGRISSNRPGLTLAEREAALEDTGSGSSSWVRGLTPPKKKGGKSSGSGGSPVGLDAKRTKAAVTQNIFNRIRALFEDMTSGPGWTMATVSLIVDAMLVVENDIAVGWLRAGKLVRFSAKEKQRGKARVAAKAIYQELFGGFDEVLKAKVNLKKAYDHGLLFGLKKPKLIRS